MAGDNSVFCDVCSRGVMLNWEHIYRCRLCSKHVCRDCFDAELKLCIDCRSLLERNRELEALQTARAPQGTPESRKADLRARRLSALKWVVLGPLLIFAATGLLWLIYPKTVFWFTIALVHSLMSIFAGLVRYPWKG